MNKTLKIILFITAGILILTGLIGLSGHFYLKPRLEDYLKNKLPDNMSLSYDTMDIRVFSGYISLENPDLRVTNKADRSPHTLLKSKSISVTGFSYAKYLFKKEIHLSGLRLERPEIVYYKDHIRPEETKTDSVKSRPISVFINHFYLDKAAVSIRENNKDSVRLSLNDLNLEISDLHISHKTFNQKIPVEYRNVKADGNDLFVKANSYDNLEVKKFSFENEDFIFNDLYYYTRYDKATLSRIIPTERDHYNIRLKTVGVSQFDVGFKDSLFFAKSKQITLQTPQVFIYRDKVVKDDPAVKPLYSSLVRNLPFSLSVDSVQIQQAFIKYTERVREDNEGGSIIFDHFDAQIAHLGNSYPQPTPTTIKIKANFMENTPFTAAWQFDVQNQSDHFSFQANIGTLEAEKMNLFTEPNLRVRLTGVTNKTYFTVDGNNDHSKTNLRINYNDFKVLFLNKENRQNKILSAIVNIFVKKDSKNQDEIFKEGSGETERDKTKSVFNFLWISLESALKNTMI